jgi:hypothetical protein
MKPDSKERLEEIFNTLLDILDEYQVSPEDGALLSANLLFSSLNFLDENEANQLSDMIDKILGSMEMPSVGIPTVFKPRNKPFSLIGLDRTWGLDPSLLDEEN